MEPGCLLYTSDAAEGFFLFTFFFATLGLFQVSQYLRLGNAIT